MRLFKSSSSRPISYCEALSAPFVFRDCHLLSEKLPEDVVRELEKLSVFGKVYEVL